MSENPAAKPRFRLFGEVARQKKGPCGAVGNPLDRNLGSNFALANRLVSAGV